MAENQEELIVEIWKKVIDVQQHFNDIELRIRNMAITLLTAVFGAVAFAVQGDMKVIIHGAQVKVGSLLLWLFLMAWGAFYFMDRFWYHRLLYGAVEHAMEIENNNPNLPLGLSTSVKKASPLLFGCIRIDSKRKIDIFYLSIFLFLLLLGFAVQFLTGPKSPTA